MPPTTHTCTPSHQAEQTDTRRGPAPGRSETPLFPVVAVFVAVTKLCLFLSKPETSQAKLLLPSSREARARGARAEAEGGGALIDLRCDLRLIC